MVNKKFDLKFFSGLLVSIILLSVLVYAIASTGLTAIQITINDTGTMLLNNTINEDIRSQINLSVNNTAPVGVGNYNITMVNITIPANSGILFISGTDSFGNDSNGSSMNGRTGGFFFLNFTNSSTASTAVETNLSWYNTTWGVANGSLTNVSTYLWFDINASTPGTYNLTITVLNGTGTWEENLTLVINDTTIPSEVNWTSQTFGNYSNNSKSGLVANATVIDNGVVKEINITLLNSAFGVVNSSNSTSGATSHYVNFTAAAGLTEGVYYINVTVNDSSGNMNASSGGFLRKIIIDRTAPAITFSCASIDINVGETVTCTCTNGTEAFSGVSTTTYNSTGASSSAGTVTERCTITDRAGNSRTSSFSYEVYPSGAAASTGGGGTSWTGTTKIITDEQFTQGITKQLAAKDRAKIKVGSNYHFVGVKEVSASTVKVEISSTPQEATLNIGDERRFDVTEDGYYDVYVKLNSITSGKADLNIKSIYEKITAKTVAEEETKETEVAATTKTGETETEKSKIWVWIVVVIIIALIIIGGGIVVKKKL